MATSTFEKELKKYWPQLTAVQKESVLHVVKNYLATEEDERVVPELGMTISEYNRELEEAVAEIERGEFYTQEEMQERIDQWKKKHAELSGTKGQKDSFEYIRIHC